MTHSCVALSSLVGTERVRRLNGKHYSNQQLFEILDVLSQHEFYIFVYFSLNLPARDDRDIPEHFAACPGYLPFLSQAAPQDAEHSAHH
jgi:hypothetical protein